MINTITLFRVLERLGSRGWRGILEGTRRLMGLQTRLLITVLGRLSRGHCLAVFAMSREIVRIYRKSGPLFLGLYLKQVHHLVLWYVGGDRTQRPSMKTYVSCSRSGLPRFIPPAYRKVIKAGVDSDGVVKIVLSVCSLSKLLLVPPKRGFGINPSTIWNKGYKPSAGCTATCNLLSKEAANLLTRYAPAYREIPLKLGLRWKPTFSSGPNTYKKPSRESNVSGASVEDGSLTIYHTLPMDAAGLLHSFHEVFLGDFGSLWVAPREFILSAGFVRIGSDEMGRKWFWTWLRSLYQGPFVATWVGRLFTRPEAGRFGRKLEGSGKIRVFAIASPILQACLRPLHDWVMSVLSTISMDGTFDQPAPLHRLRGLRRLYSFDLKSATDLLPACLSAHVLIALFGQRLAASWLTAMSQTPFRSPERMTRTHKGKVFKFNRGQPLGFYSSWPVFTLTHHLLVWIAAERRQKGKVFKNYAILGDDIVIGCPRVASEYAKLMSEVDAVISQEKSLISDKGACEFAKLIVLDNHTSARRVLSPCSMRILRSLEGFTTPFVFSKIGVSFRGSFRLRGGGYRVFSKLRSPNDRSVFRRLSRRWRRHWLSMFAPSGIHPLPIGLWLVFPFQGYIDCYQYGAVRLFLLDQVRPRSFKQEDFDRLRLYWKWDESDTVESLLEPLVQLHLIYLKWYASVIFDYSVPLEQIVRPPVAPNGLKRKSDDSLVRRYGILYKAWDFLRKTEAPKALDPLDCGYHKDFLHILEEPCPVQQKLFDTVYFLGGTL